MSQPDNLPPTPKRVFRVSDLQAMLEKVRNAPPEEKAGMLVPSDPCKDPTLLARAKELGIPVPED